jgi:hypothetical protein
VRERRQAVDVGASIRRSAGNAFGRCVRTPHGRLCAGAFERASDAQPGQPHIIGADQDVARMQRAVDDADDGGEVERAGELGDDAKRLAGRRRPVLANDRIERIGGDEILGQKGRCLDNARGERRRDRGVGQIGGNEALQAGDELVDALGRQVETEQLYRNELVLLGIVGSKDRAERTRANLMKNAERTERVRRRGTASFRVQ